MADQKIQGTISGPFLIPPGTITFPLDSEWKHENGIGTPLSCFLRPQIGIHHNLAVYEPQYKRVEKKTPCTYVDHGETYGAEKITYRVIAELGSDMFWMQYIETRFVVDGVTYVVPHSYTHHQRYTDK